MSKPIENQPDDAKDEFVQQNDIQEVVGDDNDEQEPLSGDETDDGDTLEIDMRNNSTTYFDLHTDSVYLVASHPTLPLVVSGGGDNQAYLWTTCHSPPKVAAQLNEHTESVVAGGFTANGKFLVTGDMSGRLVVWKASSSGEKWTVLSNSQEVEEIVHISFHPKFSMFSVSANDGSVWCYEISDDLENIAVLHSHSMPTTATVFIPGDDLQPRMLSASEDGLLILWDVYGSRPLYTIGPSELRGEHPWVSLALSPTGQTVAAGSMDGLVVLIKVADGSLLKTVDTTVIKPETPVGAEQATESQDGEEMSGESVEGLDWSDKTNLLATGNVDGTIVLWDTQTWRPRCQFQLRDSVTKMKFIPGTQLLTVSGIDGSLSQYDVINNKLVWECLGHNEGILDFAIQNGGKRLISASDDNVCLVFDQA